MAFLDGPPPTRLCQPMVDYIIANGGEVHLNAPVREIMLHREFRESVVDGFRLPNVRAGTRVWVWVIFEIDFATAGRCAHMYERAAPQRTGHGGAGRPLRLGHARRPHQEGLSIRAY